MSDLLGESELLNGEEYIVVLGRLSREALSPEVLWKCEESTKIKGILTDNFESFSCTDLYFPKILQ